MNQGTKQCNQRAQMYQWKLEQYFFHVLDQLYFFFMHWVILIIICYNQRESLLLFIQEEEFLDFVSWITY